MDSIKRRHCAYYHWYEWTQGDDSLLLRIMLTTDPTTALRCVSVNYKAWATTEDMRAVEMLWSEAVRIAQLWEESGKVLTDGWECVDSWAKARQVA